MPPEVEARTDTCPRRLADNDKKATVFPFTPTVLSLRRTLPTSFGQLRANPKGILSFSQGCEERATLGWSLRHPHPEGLQQSVDHQEHTAATLSGLVDAAGAVPGRTAPSFPAVAGPERCNPLDWPKLQTENARIRNNSNQRTPPDPCRFVRAWTCWWWAEVRLESSPPWRRRGWLARCPGRKPELCRRHLTLGSPCWGSSAERASLSSRFAAEGS